MKILACQNKELKVIDIDKENILQEFYDVIKCQCIDMKTFVVKDKHYNKNKNEITVNDVIYNIWFDDEFLLFNSPCPTFEYKGLMISGNWVITKNDGDDDTDLTDDEINLVKQYFIG